MSAGVATRPDARRGLPGAEGFWVFVAGDLALFTLLFFSFLDARAGDPTAYETARAGLDLHRGGLNTVILLTSSLAVALALVQIRAGAVTRARQWLAAGILGGVLFVGLKVSEYVSTFGDGRAVEGFYSYYAAITGMHLAHVLGGIAVLSIFWFRWGRPQLPSESHSVTMACYWHLVDFLWIAIFPLLYLVR